MFANVCPRNNYLYSPLFGQLGAPLELCSKIWSRCQFFVYFLIEVLLSHVLGVFGSLVAAKIYVISNV